MKVIGLGTRTRGTCKVREYEGK
ncbi:hypothetical protein E2C01_061086 [Portunus trituberculatus]|uniref:Uncharacterized protein n=1 Tax=Portunus trituberculatus TaxID=210409 RepID=A0A5B7HDE5_PORTR|nr:hypothetical protein [Portunus trituberculatus]